MKHIKKFEGWNPLNIFKDSGSFSIKYIPRPNEKEEITVFGDTTRKEAIQSLINQFPNAKIISVTKMKNGEFDEVEIDDID